MLSMMVAAAAASAPAVDASPSPSPRFVAEVADDARIAAEAWQAATECTGKPGRAHAIVEVVRGAVRGDYLGLALHDEAGLYRIELSADENRLAEVIVHEVAHGWITAGPPTLVEGRTELLADCIVSRRPGLAPLQWDDGRALASLPDLRTWSNTDDHGPAVLADQRTDAYLGAARLLRTVSLLVDDRALWQPELDWHDLTALLTDDEAGRTILEVLEGGAAAQRHALDDPDRDGLPTLAEHLLGTDPARWDSDADGWWDGSLLGVPARSIPLSLDGTPVCAGLAGGPGGGRAAVVRGGNLRGHGLPDARLRAGDRAGVQLEVPAGAPLVVELTHGADGEAPGGAWARVRGQGLVPDEGCVVTPVASVWALSPALAERIPELLALVEEAATRAEALWGPPPGRVALAVGGDRTLYEGGVLYLSEAELTRARQRGKLAEVAALAVTAPHAWRNGSRDWTTGEALARALWRYEPVASVDRR